MRSGKPSFQGGDIGKKGQGLDLWKNLRVGCGEFDKALRTPNYKC